MPLIRPLRFTAPVLSAAVLLLATTACVDRRHPVAPAAAPAPQAPGIAFDVFGTTRTWAGTVSTDWSTAGNWDGGLVPADADSVRIPADAFNFPVLTSNVAVSSVTVDDGALLNLGAFNLTSTGSVVTGPTAGSGITGTTGNLILAGTAKTVSGRLPRVRVTGTYSVNGLYWGMAPQTVSAGRLTVSGFEMNIGN